MMFTHKIYVTGLEFICFSLINAVSVNDRKLKRYFSLALHLQYSFSLFRDGDLTYLRLQTRLLLLLGLKRQFLPQRLLLCLSTQWLLLLLLLQCTGYRFLRRKYTLRHFGFLGVNVLVVAVIDETIFGKVLDLYRWNKMPFDTENKGETLLVK